jgi:RimJ/RimL family protein N-acetyltransferase
MSVRSLDRLESARIVYERLRPDHAEEVARLLLDPRVARTLWPTMHPPTPADLDESMRARCVHWERNGFGLWLLRDRQTGEMVGRGGLQYTFVAEVHAVEAGWAIVPERWGQGLATELAQTCVEVGFGDLGLREIVAFALPDNIASRRVMEKAGFVFDRPTMHAGLPHVLYRRRAPAPLLGSAGQPL